MLLILAILGQFEPTGVFAQSQPTVIDVYMPTWCTTCPQWRPLLVNDKDVVFRFVASNAPTVEAKSYPAFYSAGTYLDSAYAGMSISALKSKAMRERLKLVEGSSKDAKFAIGDRVTVEFRVTASRLTADGRHVLTLEALDKQGTEVPYNPTFVCDDKLVRKAK